jgi:hypothetical protein
VWPPPAVKIDLTEGKELLLTLMASFSQRSNSGAGEPLRSISTCTGWSLSPQWMIAASLGGLSFTVSQILSLGARLRCSLAARAS